MKLIDKVECKEGSNVVLVSAKQEVETSIMRENTSLFKLAHALTLLEGGLLGGLGMLEDGALACDILTNRACLKKYPEVEELLSLFRSGKIIMHNAHIATDQWIDYWKKAKERTASSCSGLHFRHYKCMQK